MTDFEIVPPGGYWSAIISKNSILKITDIKGGQGVDFLCYNADNTTERYHSPNTLKAALTLKLSRGHNLYSDEARPIFKITEDTFGGHDTIGGCCSEASNKMLYGVNGVSGCRENFLIAIKKFGLGRKDIVPNVNFFCEVPVSGEGLLSEHVFVANKKIPGSSVKLLARMKALAVISNCPQVNNPCNHGTPTPIKVSIEN